MSYRYAILGAGMQGMAAAYDLAQFGEAEQVLLADMDLARAERAAARVNGLLGEGRKIVKAQQVNVKDRSALVGLLEKIDCVLSAVPYYLNLDITRAAIEAKANMCDLGGNTDIVLEQLKLDSKGKQAGITAIPDCGLAPGMANTLAVYGMRKMDRCKEVQIRCGGLPQSPKPPLNYKLLFNIEGLTNEYFGKAYILRDGKVKKIDTFTELEEIEFPPPVGRCEAFVTAGGTSTCPWTFAGKLERYEYKTVRYPGHYEKFKTMLELGLLDLEPVQVSNAKVVPRELFHKVVAPRIDFPDDPDLVVLKVICRGEKGDKPMEVALDIIDFHDEETGFSAMERTTAFPASVVAIMLARGETEKGVISLERAISADKFVAELPKRAIKLTETIKRPIT